MARAPKKWNLTDVVDFEELLGEGDEISVSAEERRGLGEVLQRTRKRSRAIQRRRGLRAWLELRRETEDLAAGAHVALGLRLASVLVAVGAFLVGVGVMRGLLTEVPEQGKVYHLWVFLAVTLGLQWVFLVFGVIGWLSFRREKSLSSILSVGLGWLAQRFSPGVEKNLWQRLKSAAGGYSAVMGWRLARMSQGAAVCYNVGLVLGFLGCLWFFGVQFYWESTIGGLSGYQLYAVADLLALPWSWTGVALPPEQAELNFDLLTKRFSPPEEGNQWLFFLTMALIVWGVVPRLLLWIAAWRGERRALGKLDFQDRRHRALWRKLARDERTVLQEGPADGVVLLQVGGLVVDPESLRGFLLRKMRVHAEAVFSAAVLDEEDETEALAAIRKAPLGVVFLVEGWALSPKEMQALYERVRAAGGERPFRFLVVGAIVDGAPSAPEAAEYSQWEAFVDGLRDPDAEVVAYENLDTVSTE